MAVQQTTTQTILPEWYTQYAQNLTGKAMSAAEQPYQTYNLPRIAGFQPEQEQAFSGYQESMGEYRPYIQQAASSLQRGTGSFTDPGVARKYMNPYVENVVSGIGSAAARNLYENILPQINRTFVGGGTFGGSRSQEFMNRAIRDTQASALSAQSKAMMEGYNTAADLYGSEANRAITAAPYMGALGTQAQEQRTKELSGLEAIGAARQGLAQKSADLAYEDFIAQRDYPWTQLERMSGVAGTPSGTGSTTIEKAPGPSTASQILGNLAGIAGILGSAGVFKDGGKVSNRKAGLGWLKDVK